MIIDREHDILARTQFVFFCDLYADYTLWFSITSTCLSTKNFLESIEEIVLMISLAG